MRTAGAWHTRQSLPLHMSMMAVTYNIFAVLQHLPVLLPEAPQELHERATMSSSTLSDSCERQRWQQLYVSSRKEAFVSDHEACLWACSCRDDHGPDILGSCLRVVEEHPELARHLALHAPHACVKPV